MSVPLTIPLSISAKTPEELTEKMLAWNSKAGTHFQYFDISFDGKRWVAWYYVNIEQYAHLFAMKKEENKPKKVKKNGTPKR